MKMSIKEASEKMGISEMFLRLIIREEKLDKNIAFCIKHKDRYSYYINRKSFETYINMSDNFNSA